jgi:hypothetical protein
LTYGTTEVVPDIDLLRASPSKGQAV